MIEIEGSDEKSIIGTFLSLFPVSHRATVPTTVLTSLPLGAF